MRKYFGTDGVRGKANTYPMTADFALRLGNAAGRYFRSASNKRRVVIGKDTRRSCYMIENALASGLMSAGMNVIFLGPVPTPGVGMLTRSMRADLGIMISASHNQHNDNGIKFFGPDGYKLTDDAELALEALVDDAPDFVAAEEIGNAKRVDFVDGRYVEYAKTTFPRKKNLNGLKVVVDCANGAAYKTAPEVLYELGAEVVPIGVSPNGFNINLECGSTHPENAAKAVLEHKADLGICLDGDADRIILIDEKGNVADGDQLMALIAMYLKKEERLFKNVLVATVMSNMGLEKFLEANEISLKRTQVGDRYVVNEMRQGNYSLGGEQSGHIILRDYVTTGDGLIAGLQFLAAMVESGKPASELANQFTAFPQLLENVRYSGTLDPLDQEQVKAAISQGEAEFGDRGRLVIRKSGTEPLIRVMGECTDAALLERVVKGIAAEIKSHA